MKKYTKPVLLSMLVVSLCMLAASLHAIPYPQQLNILGQTDSIRHELGKDQPDSVRFLLLKEIAADLSDQRVDSALKYALEAKDLVESKGLSKYAGAAYFICGVVFMNKTDNRKALQYYFRALRIFEKEQKYENAMKCYNNIGVVYLNLQRKEEAKAYFLKALETRNKNNVKSPAGLIYISIGSTLSGQGRIEEAQPYFFKALEEGRRIKNYYQVSMALINLSADNNTRGNTRLARRYANEALKLNLERNDQHHLAMCNFVLGQVAMKERKYPEAEKYFVISATYAEKAGVKSRVKETLEMLSQVYFEQKRFKEAYEARKKYEAMKDSALNEEVNREVSELQNRYEVERKNTEISLLSKDKEIAEGKAAREQLWRNLLVIAVMVVLIIAGILFRNVSLKQKLNEVLSRKNEQISRQKEKVEQKNAELKQENISAKYEVLKSKIDPHFLFNSLSTLQSLILKDQQHAIRFVEKFSELYRLILDASEHQLVSLRQEMMIVNNYLYLQKVKSGENIVTDIQISGQDKELLVPSFVVQMMVENAIKHNVVSSSKKLHIRICIENNTVRVENNLQPKPVKPASTFTGHRNIRGRYELLGNDRPEFYTENARYVAILPLITILLPDQQP